MNNLKTCKYLKLNIMDILLIALTLLGNILASIFLKDFNILPFLMNIISIIGVILAAKGNFVYTFFSITYQIIYVIISFSSGVYGDALITLIYYIPMLIYTAIFWKKQHSDNSVLEVKVKKLNTKQWILVVCSFFAISCLGYFALRLVNSDYALIDAITSALFIVSAFIGARAFTEQWIFWSLLNLLEFIMWLIVFLDNYNYDALVTTIMTFLHLVNAIYGLFNWTKLRRTQTTS